MTPQLTRFPQTLLFAMLLAALAATPPKWAAAQEGLARDGVLQVATREVPPFAMRDEQGEWHGISVELVEEVRRDLEAQRGKEVTVVFQEMGLDEMLSGVEAGDVDLAAAALTVTFEREKRVDFSHPFFSSGLGIAVDSAGKTGFWIVVRQVLSPTFFRIVAGLLAMVLASGVAVYFFERRINREQFGGGAIRGILSGLWWSAVTLTTVGYGDKVPKSAAGRAIGMAWMFLGLFIIASFTAAVTSVLTVSELQSHISGPEYLMRSRVATVEDSTSAAYLRSRQVFYRSYEDVAAALASLAAGRSDAVVYDAPVLRYEVHRRFADELLVLPGEFQGQDYAFALPPGSPLQEVVNQSLLRKTSSADWEDYLTELLGEPAAD